MVVEVPKRVVNKRVVVRSMADPDLDDLEDAEEGANRMGKKMRAAGGWVGGQATGGGFC